MQFDSFEQKPHDLNELLNLVVDQVGEFTKTERVLIYLYDEHDEVLWNRAGKGAEFMELEFKIGQGVPGQVMEKAKPFIIPDVAHDTRFDAKIDDITDVPVKSMLCSPIISNDGKKVGVIQLINKDGEFDDKDVAFVAAMSAQAAIGIDNTLLFTSLQQLRKRELELAEEIKEQNEKLQEAYLKVEAESKDVKESSEKVGRNRMIAMVGFIGLFLLIGIYVWRSAYVSSSSEEFAPPVLPEAVQAVVSASAAGAVADPTTFTVETEPLSFPLTLSGNLEPESIENMFVPFEGRILKKNYVIGERVEKGQILLEISTEKIQANYRTAKITEINALEEFEKKKDWATGKEIADAQRELLRAEEDLETSKKLFDLGIISKDQLTRSEDGLRNANAKKKAVEKQGNEQAVQIAEFKWENAKLAERELSEKIEKSVISAGVDGVAIQPQSGRDRKKRTVETGVSIDEGVVFVTVADLTRLKVLGRVDETEISLVKQGQSVQISGEAFPGVILEGDVVYVSSEAKKGGRKPYFEIRVVTDPLSEEQSKRIRLGMSATLSIVTYSNPEAILVPFEVIKIAQDGTYVFKVTPGAAEPERVQVQTGVTTPTAVEIVSGIEPGDKLLLLTI